MNTLITINQGISLPSSPLSQYSHPTEAVELIGSLIKDSEEQEAVKKIYLSNNLLTWLARTDCGNWALTRESWMLLPCHVVASSPEKASNHSGTWSWLPCSRVYLSIYFPIFMRQQFRCIIDINYTYKFRFIFKQK